MGFHQTIYHLANVSSPHHGALYERLIDEEVGIYQFIASKGSPSTNEKNCIFGGGVLLLVGPNHYQDADHIYPPPTIYLRG